MQLIFITLNYIYIFYNLKLLLLQQSILLLLSNFQILKANLGQEFKSLTAKHRSIGWFQTYIDPGLILFYKFIISKKYFFIVLKRFFYVI